MANPPKGLIDICGRHVSLIPWTAWLFLAFKDESMVGAIKSSDILLHPIATVRTFGWRIFFKAIGPWQGGSFISLLREAGILENGTSNLPTILQRCVALELRAKRIYRTLAIALGEQTVIGGFFAGLVEQEQYHVELLEACRAASIRGRWKANLFSPWNEFLPRLEKQMDAAEAAVAEIDSIEAALLMVVEIEASEINQVFYAALAATDAAFVKRLRPFRDAMEAHMNYLVERLPELSPNMALACENLRTKFPGMQPP